MLRLLFSFFSTTHGHKNNIDVLVAGPHFFFLLFFCFLISFLDQKLLLICILKRKQLFPSPMSHRFHGTRCKRASLSCL